ncbi:MAG: hypothetical protein CL854_03680, partial [Cryomorphaceae bacterium]|nr:hypothetical protein [Cryomorphaceae bacterium]
PTHFCVSALFSVGPPGLEPGPTENKALTQKCVGALPFYTVPICSYGLEMFLIYLPIKNANFKWFMRITEALKT